MNNVEDEKLTVLSAPEETSFIFGNFLLYPVFSTISVVLLIKILYNLKHKSIGNAEKTRKAAICAIVSISFTLICTIGNLLAASNFYFPIDFSALNYGLCDVMNFVSNFSWTFGKIFFYAAFNLHVLQYSEDHNSRWFMNNRSLLKIWLYCANTLIFILMTIYFLDDALEQHMKEIGKLPIHNVYLAMVVSHEGAHYTHIAFACLMVVDMLYFGVLLSCYINAAKSKANADSFSVIKASVLVIFACIALWMFVISVALQLPISWCMAPLDIVSDDISLFLMFPFNDGIYLNVCGCCHRSLSNTFFAGKGHNAIVADLDLHSDMESNSDSVAEHSSANFTDDSSAHTDSALLSDS